MKRFQGVLLAAGALAALVAGVMLHRSQTVISPRVDPAQAVATSSESPVSTVSPDAMTGKATSSTAFPARAAAAENLATGGLLYQFHPDLRWPIASITKLMTAEVVSDQMSLSQTITLAQSDFAGGTDTLTANLQPGDEYRAADLLKVMLIPSSNEAAEAFARTYGRDRFIAAMNAQAAAWGLKSTHFDDPSGLSAANQSTPRELLQIVREIYEKHPEIFAITQSRAANAQDLVTGVLKQFPTTNSFAGRAGFVGGKTGTTPEAGDNLVSIFQMRGGPVAIVVLDAADRYAASESLLQWLETNSRP